MVKRRIFYLLALAGCLVFYGAYQQWFAWLLLMAMVFFPWLSLVLSLRAMMGIKLEPHCPTRVPMGTPAEVALSVYSKLPQPPLKAKIRLTKPNTGESWLLRPGAPLPTDHSGGLTIQLHRPKVYDYLGLFSLKVRNNEPGTVFIMPQPATMEVPPDLSRYVARSWRPKPGGGYAENHEIRQYHPGDNLNQVHWKLSAKVDDLMLREPMEPKQALMLLTMDLNGTPAELDSKYSRLLWFGSWFLERQIPFEVRALTGRGIESWAVQSDWELNACIEGLLLAPFASGGSIRTQSFPAAWQHHIGGESHEA